MSDARSLRPSNYRHHKPSGQAVVTIAGRDFYLGKYDPAASHEEHRRLVAEYWRTGTAPVIVALWRYRGYFEDDSERMWGLIGQPRGSLACLSGSGSGFG